MRLKALSCLAVGAIGYWAAGVGVADSAPDAARPSTASASHPARTFAASAEAEGMRVTFDAPQFLVVSTLFDAANPVSQATLESTGVSRSFASAPYPGDLIVTAPGTLAAFGGPSLPAQYPFYVSANHPETPKAALDDPGGSYSLAATAEAGRSAASGRLSVAKGPVVRTEALTETLADGAVRAVASSVTEGIVAGDGALTIGRVISSVETLSRPGAAEPAVTRRFEITGAKVGEVVVEITADGVKAGGGALPVGQAAEPVQASLAKAGLDVRVEGDEALQGGGTARTLIIKSTQQAPLPGAPQGVLTIRVGGAATAVLTGAAANVDLPGSPSGALPPPAPGSDGDGSPSASGGAGTFPGSGAPGSEWPTGSGSASFGGSSACGAGSSGASPSGCGSEFPAASPVGPGSAGGGGAGGGTSPSGEGGVLAAGPDTARIVSVPTALPVRRAVRWIFVVLAAGGALALAGSASFRRLGVQSTWMS